MSKPARTGIVPWPGSLAGQLATLLAAGLLVAHLLSVLVFRFNAEVLNPVARARVLERVATTWRMIQLASAEEMPEVLETLSSDSGRFWIESDPLADPGHLTAEEQRMLNVLRSRLPQVPAGHMRLSLDISHSEPFGEFEAELGWWIVPLQTSVRLPDGRWLHGRQQPLAGYQWWRLLRFSLPTSLLPVLLIVLVFGWRIVRPIRALAGAAERISHGERIALREDRGPMEVREVSAAFNAMQEKLARFIEDRTRLLAAISHDFRTPITSLRLRAELIEASQHREAMIRTLDEMRRMVEETLVFARDDAVGEEARDTDLPTLLEEIVQEQKAVGRDVAFELAQPVVRRVRPIGLKRAIVNLVDNAVRHGRSARLRLAVPSAGGLAIEVDDKGPGLAPELLGRAFEPFFQADPSRHRQAGDGVGLGLSIARSCARAHGGDVVLSNLPEGGLRATLWLP